MYSDRDWRGADASYARALRVAPGNALALSGAGVLAYGMGRLEKAVELYRMALEQDPLSSVTYNRLALALFRLDRFEEAEVILRKALEVAPQRGVSRGVLAQVLQSQGRGEEAVEMATEEPAVWARLMALAIVHHNLGDTVKSDAALRALIEGHAQHAALQIAEVHGARGEVDAAFEWLEVAYSQEDPGLSEIRTSPSLRSLHGDPRWGAFLRKMGLED